MIVCYLDPFAAEPEHVRRVRAAEMVKEVLKPPDLDRDLKIPSVIDHLLRDRGIRADEDVEPDEAPHHFSVVVEPLVDGMTISACAQLFQHNRRALEDGKLRDLSLMTNAQIAAGKAEWLSRWTVDHEAALKAKQDEAREKERCQVVCDIQEIE